MKSLQPSQNTLTKRESSNREFITKAGLIGLCNLYGIDFSVKIVKKTSREKKTIDNLLIESSSLFPEMDSMEKKTLLDSFDRNNMKSYEANQFNFLANYLFTEFKLNYHLTKSRSTTKTVKLFKYRWIDPFNEEGFKIFGTKVIEIINGMQKESEDKKHCYVRLDRCNLELYNMYYSLVTNPEYISSHGMEMVQSWLSQCNTDNTNGTEVKTEMNVNDDMNIVMNQENGSCSTLNTYCTMYTTNTDYTQQNVNMEKNDNYENGVHYDISYYQNNNPMMYQIPEAQYEIQEERM